MISYTAKWQRKMKNGSIEYGERIFFKLKSAEKFLEKKLKNLTVQSLVGGSLKTNSAG